MNVYIMFDKTRTFIKLKQPNGDLVEFWSKQFSPLNFESLKAAINNKTLFELEVEAEEISVTSGGNKRIIAEKFVKVPINFHHPVPFYALVENGWLPAPFVKSKSFLIDSNVVIHLEKVIAGKIMNDSPQKDWWLEMMKDNGVLFNPLLYAFEGKTKTFPSLQEFTDNLNESISTIKKLLPNVRIVEYNDEVVNQVYGVLQQVIQRYNTTYDFLIQANPIILHNSAPADIEKKQNQIFEIAEKTGVSFISFPFLCVLSCLYESPDANFYKAARKVLRLSENYSPDAAYNAMADLRCLELYAASLGLSDGGEPFAFCTSDKPLAVFGVGLNPRNVIIDDRGATFKVSIDENLFPRLAVDEREPLVKRILSA